MEGEYARVCAAPRIIGVARCRAEPDSRFRDSAGPVAETRPWGGATPGAVTATAWVPEGPPRRSDQRPGERPVHPRHVRPGRAAVCDGFRADRLRVRSIG